MNRYSFERSLATSNSATYPILIPIGMLLAIEEAAKDRKETTAEFILSAVACDLEGHFDSKRLKQRRANDQSTLQRLSKSKKITIIQQDNHP